MDIKSSCVFVPKMSLGMREASSDIAANVQAAWQSGAVGEVLVVCLPALGIHSVANTPMDVLQDIPITMPHGALLSKCSCLTAQGCSSGVHWNVCMRVLYMCVCMSEWMCVCMCVEFIDLIPVFPCNFCSSFPSFHVLVFRPVLSV